MVHRGGGCVVDLCTDKKRVKEWYSVLAAYTTRGLDGLAHRSGCISDQKQELSVKVRRNADEKNALCCNTPEPDLHSQAERGWRLEECSRAASPGLLRKRRCLRVSNATKQ